MGLTTYQTVCWELSRALQADGYRTVIHNKVRAVTENWTKCHGHQEGKAHISLDDPRKALPMSYCPEKCFLFIPASRNRLHLLIGGWDVCAGMKELIAAILELSNYSLDQQVGTFEKGPRSVLTFFSDRLASWRWRRLSGGWQRIGFCLLWSCPRTRATATGKGILASVTLRNSARAEQPAEPPVTPTVLKRNTLR